MKQIHVDTERSRLILDLRSGGIKLRHFAYQFMRLDETNTLEPCASFLLSTMLYKQKHVTPYHAEEDVTGPKLSVGHRQWTEKEDAENYSLHSFGVSGVWAFSH